MFEKLTNFTHNFWKKSFFPEDLEGASSFENYEKQLSRNYFRNDFVSEGTFPVALVRTLLFAFFVTCGV